MLMFYIGFMYTYQWNLNNLGQVFNFLSHVNKKYIILFCLLRLHKNSNKTLDWLILITQIIKLTRVCS